MNKIRVLVVDDSAYMRQTVSRMLTSDPLIEISGTAKNGKDALEKISVLKPDCVTLDMEMPEMDGLQTVQELMRENPLPVVLLTMLSRDNEKVICALEEGAVDFVQKPEGLFSVQKAQEELVLKVKQASRVPREKLARKLARKILRRVKPPVKKSILGIASSTGGPGALWQIIPLLPDAFPVPVVVVQHMPEGFTRSLSERLNKQSNLYVKEAEDGEEIREGLVYIGRGGKQLRLRQENDKKVFRLTDEASGRFVAPSADFSFSDMAALYGRGCLAVVLTGMGDDGLEGAKKIKESGGTILAQDEATSIVYGMPKAVAEHGLADEILSISQMAEKIAEMV